MYFNGYEDICVCDITLDSGKARGLSALLVRNGAFECMIVKDRALDIAHASFRGTGVAFVSRNGLSASVGQFAKTFEGGLLYTCGFDNLSTCVEGVYLHGTLHTTPADNVRYDIKDGCVYVRGEITVTGLFCDSLVLHRELCVRNNGVTVNDRIENTRGADAEYCLLYHCNFGAPFLEKDGEVKIDHLTREGLTPYAQKTEASAGNITEPVPAIEEAVYYHTVKEGKAQYLNPHLGMGVEITYDKEKLPVFIEWKSMAEEDYALGLEPATTRFDTFKKTPIKAGESHTYEVSIRFFS